MVMSELNRNVLPPTGPHAEIQSVYVIDDDLDLRSSLQFLLSTWGITVAAFADAPAFLKSVADLAPAPVILDVRMPSVDGMQLFSELIERNIDWPVIFLTGHGELAVAVSALKLGAVDFLEKPVAAADLQICLDRAFDKLKRDQIVAAGKMAAKATWGLLTAREKEVLNGLSQGLSNKQVAFNLALSTRTVEMHRANALRRLRVRSLAEVVTIMTKQTQI